MIRDSPLWLALILKGGLIKKATDLGVHPWLRYQF